MAAIANPIFRSTLKNLGVGAFTRFIIFIFSLFLSFPRRRERSSFQSQESRLNNQFYTFIFVQSPVNHIF
jgi:hypothetical protein